MPGVRRWSTRRGSLPASRRCRSGARSRAIEGDATMKRAVVIGAGFGGLALAIRLQSAGVDDDAGRGARQARRARLLSGSRTASPSMPGRPSSPIPTACRNCGRCPASDMADDVDADAGHALLPAQLARRHQFRLFERRSARCAREIAQLDPDDVAGLRASSSTIRPASIAKGYVKLGHVAVPRLRVDDQGRAGAGEIPGVALGLFDRLELREEREAARGAVASTRCWSAAIR